MILTILKNISQLEGLSHILWKIKNMFQTTNQYTFIQAKLAFPAHLRHTNVDGGFVEFPRDGKHRKKKSHIFGQVLFWTSNMKLLSKYHPISVVSKINIQRKCYQNQHHPISVVSQRFQSFKSSSFSCWAISVSATFFILAKRSWPKLFKQSCILYSIYIQIYVVSYVYIYTFVSSPVVDSVLARSLSLSLLISK